MKDNRDYIEVLRQTAQNLEQQAEILKRQSRDLRQEATRLRAAAKKARLFYKTSGTERDGRQSHIKKPRRSPLKQT